MNDLVKFLFEKMPLGVIVFDHKIKIKYSNRQGIKFLKRYEPPVELSSISRKIFEANSSDCLERLFPGEIYVSKKLEGSPSHWTFKFEIYKKPVLLVAIFIIEEAFANKVDLNEMRRRVGLTRRETDVCRQTLNGLKNTEIAEDLNISEQTVKDHLSTIYRKLGVKNRFELISATVNHPEHENKE